MTEWAEAVGWEGLPAATEGVTAMSDIRDARPTKHKNGR